MDALSRKKKLELLGHQCPECFQEFRSRAYIREHILLLHLKLGMGKCGECGKEFRQLSDLRDHCANKHPRSPENFLQHLQKYSERIDDFILERLDTIDTPDPKKLQRKEQEKKLKGTVYITTKCNLAI